MRFFDVYENWYGDTLLGVYPRKNNTNDKTEVKTMNKNKAPCEIEGNYMVTINGNETVIIPVGFEDAVHLYKKNRDKSKSYKCHPDDKFDAGWVLNDYLEKKDKIDIDDEVIVVDCGECYPDARDWIVFFANAMRELHNEKLANDILLNWGRRLPNYDSGTFRVVDSAFFTFERVKDVYLIVNEKTNKFYLIDRKGLKKVQ